jgi:hypothetical protein
MCVWARGADLLIRPNSFSWFYVPLPTPVFIPDRPRAIRRTRRQLRTPTPAAAHYQWLLGELPTDALTEQQDPEVHYSGSVDAAVIRTYRQHDAALLNFLVNRRDDDQARQMRQRSVGPLAAARIMMQENGWPLPPIPQDVFKALEPALFRMGLA